MEHAVSVLKALYIIFIGKNQCLYEESECDFYFRSLIVALYCIMRFLCFSASFIHIVHPYWASAQRKLIYITTLL